MFGNKKTIDFLAIGDIVVDAFITLKDAHIHNKLDNVSSELCVSFGDKIPYESVDVVYAVGNSPNAAVSASRLGLSSALLASVGDDENGKKCLDAFKKDGVITDYINIDKNLETNYHYVLRYGVERTILVKHQDFVKKLPKNLPKIGWIYLSSLGTNTLEYHKEILEFLKQNPDTKLAFQPGTFQMKLGLEKLGDIYKRSDIFFCNLEEAQRILNTTEGDVKILIKKLHFLGPKIVCVSDGPNGAYASDGINIFYVPQYPDTGPLVDRTGAGDAFASTFTSMIALGKNVEEALAYAPINSMSVVQYIGAQKGLLNMAKLEDLKKNAPASYAVKVLNK